MFLYAHAAKGENQEQHIPGSLSRSCDTDMFEHCDNTTEMRYAKLSVGSHHGQRVTDGFNQ